MQNFAAEFYQKGSWRILIIYFTQLWDIQGNEMRIYFFECGKSRTFCKCSNGRKTSCLLEDFSKSRQIFADQDASWMFLSLELLKLNQADPEDGKLSLLSSLSELLAYENLLVELLP